MLDRALSVSLCRSVSESAERRHLLADATYLILLSDAMSARDFIKSGVRNVKKAFGLSDSHANEVEGEPGREDGSPVAEQVEGEEEAQAVGGGRSVGFEDGPPDGQEETTRERVMFAEPPPPSKEKDKPARRGVVLVLEPGEKQGSTPRSQAKARKDPLPQVRE